MYKLHYAHKDLEDNIPTFNFKHLDEMGDYINEILNRDDSETVYLFTYDAKAKGQEEVNITNHRIPLLFYVVQVFEAIENAEQIYGKIEPIKNFFLFEYKSYEVAYQQALLMKEENPLCYDKRED
jgi:hypothetical protein